YVAELGGIRKIAADGSITSTFVGSLSAAGGYSISAGSAGIECPVGLAVDKFQNVFIADCKHDQILKLAPDGQVNTLPNRGIVGYEKQVIGGAIFSPPVIVSIPVYGRFSQPEGVAIDAIGRLFVADHKNHCVRRFAPDDPGRSDFNTI